MFKKALQVAATFGLLLAAYAGYDRAFALLAARIRAAQVMPVERFEQQPKRNFLRAIELAARAFGPAHWSADPARDMYRYYSAEQGYWMYAKNYKSLKEGKLLVFEPFALIWVSRDGKELKTATSDKAIVLLDQPYDFVLKPGADSELHVVNARLEGNVHLRDDKGTANPDDDLRISGREGEGLTYAEYDELTQKITHDSYVTIEDGDMRVSGKSIEIALRPKETPAPGRAAGYSGPQTIYLRKDVHIIIKDVGRSGVMPGSSKPTAPKQGAKTPLDLRCDGLARFDLPKPQPDLPLQVAGPPPPPLPTLAEFDRNVEVVRGRAGEPQDRLLCDHLRLIFYPGAKPAPGPKPAADVRLEVAGTKTPNDSAKRQAGATAEPETAASPLGGLVLRRAVATGHNVELFSPAQGLKVRHCNELIHNKFPGRKPGETDDKTYLRTDLTRKLEIEKREFASDGPDKGKLTSVDHIRCVDATVFQRGDDNEQATIVARGPGIFESRPALDKPVERTAVWNDALEYTPVHNDKGELRKRVTLTDSPKFHAIQEQTTLDARRMLVIYLRPKAAKGAKGPAAGSTAEAFELDGLVGFGDVHLNAPDRHLTADEQLDAIFEPAPAAPDNASNAVVAGDPFTTAAPAAPPTAAAKKNDEPKPGEPPVFVHARRVKAHIAMLPADRAAPGGAAASGNRSTRPAASTSKGELRRVYLAGAVTFHQDPAPGEAKGTDVSGEACWGQTSGDGLWTFHVYDHEPLKQGETFPTGGLAQSDLAALAPARVANKDITIEGPFIGLIQASDTAWVYGPGKLVMMTERDLLRDKDSANPGDKKIVPTVATVRTAERVSAPPDGKAKPATEKVPVTITWISEMRFFGQSQDPTGRPTARAEFFSDPKDPPVKRFRFPTGTLAETENGLIKCQDMKVYFDRPIKLARLRRVPAAGGAAQDPDAEPEPKHDINLIECFDNVVAISRKVDDSKHLAQQERVEGSQLVYDKVVGDFYVPGKGVVKYWNVKGESAGAQPAGSDTTPRAPAVTRTSSTRGQKPVANAGGTRGAADPKKPAKPAAPKRPLELTVIKFDHDMKGNFLPGKEGERKARKADFFGNVEALHAPVADTKVEFVFDKPPPQYSLMTAQTMRLISEPAGATAPPGSAARTYMQAFDNAYVKREDSTIQADKITYDSEKDLFWAYGYEGRPVSIWQSKGVGQDPSKTVGRAAYMIRRTGEAQVVDPQNFQLVDRKTGVRPQADPPETAKRAKRPKRGNPPKRGDVERRTFTGK